MTDEQKTTANMQDLSYDSACRIVRLYQYLTNQNQSSLITNHESLNHESEYVISKQIYRSGTSIGANTREAQHAQSDPDFYSKMSIAFKEADETSYWLNLLHDNGYLNDGQFTSLDNDITRIIKLLTSITKSTRQRIASAKNH